MPAERLQRAKVGRPTGVSSETLDKVLPVALRLFLTEGAHSLTPTRIASESGITRATIYRNWPNREVMMAELIYRATSRKVLASHGSLEADLYAEMKALISKLETRPVRAFFGACLDYREQSEETSRIAGEFVTGITEGFRQILKNALKTKKIVGDIDLLMDELIGPILYRHVLLGERVSQTLGAQRVAIFLKNRV